MFNPTVDLYRGLSMPVLLFSGTESMSNPTFATAEFENILSDVRTAVLENQGHTANVSAPDLVAGYISEFISEIFY